MAALVFERDIGERARKRGGGEVGKSLGEKKRTGQKGELETERAGECSEKELEKGKEVRETEGEKEESQVEMERRRDGRE